MKNKKMKIARVEMDLSQEQLADLVGATRQTIGMIESGKRSEERRVGKECM